MPTNVKVITISLPVELVDAIDKAATANYANRSEYIRRVMVARLEVEGQLDAATEQRLRQMRLSNYLRSAIPDDPKLW